MYNAELKIYGWKQNYITLGDIFINKTFIKLDADSMQIGFVTKGKEWVGILVIFIVSVATVIFVLYILRLREKNIRHV